MSTQPTEERWTVANDERGVRTLVERLRSLEPQLLVLEATGGYELLCVAALAAAGLPVVVVDPRQVRDFAKATGQLAKTDRLDANILALFADRVPPTPRPLPEPGLQQLDARRTRRRQVLERLTAERNRLEHAVVPIRRNLADHIRWLERRVADVDRDLDRTIESSPIWRAKEHLLRSVPGGGPVVRRTRRADVPELGPLHRTPIAALVGVAPLARDRGTLRGKRIVWGGRAPVRAVLDMGALVATRRNAVIRVFYHRLIAAGKPKKVALTACMRKLLTILNAMMRTNTTWRQVNQPGCT